MKNLKIKFNIMDFIIIFTILLIIALSFLQSVSVKEFEQNNTIEDTVITLRINNIDEKVYSKITKGNNLYCEDVFGETPFGTVVKKLKHTSSQKIEGDDSVTNEITEYELQVNSKCFRNSDGFYSINDEFIIPGMVITADNGTVGFSCEIMSVKKAE